MKILPRPISLLFASALFFASGAAAQGAGFPGDASSVKETHGDWVVACGLVASPDGDPEKRCTLSQQQVSQQNGQRVFAVELVAHADGARGAAILPFGLLLDQGIAYQIDTMEAVPQRFRTCLPIGCVTDLTFTGPTLASLRAGKALKLAVVAEGGQDLVFTVSLAGFSGAYDRAIDLTR